MNVHEALDAWQAQYSGQPPVGFMLRFTHESVWTRIHYLRQRVEPATAEDDRLTASRFDAVASALFTGTTVLVLAIHLDPSHEDTADLRALGAAPMSPPASWIETLGGYLRGPIRAEFVATTLTLAARLPGQAVAGGGPRSDRPDRGLLPGHRRRLLPLRRRRRRLRLGFRATLQTRRRFRAGMPDADGHGSGAALAAPSGVASSGG